MNQQTEAYGNSKPYMAKKHWNWLKPLFKQVAQKKADFSGMTEDKK